MFVTCCQFHVLPSSQCASDGNVLSLSVSVQQGFAVVQLLLLRQFVQPGSSPGSVASLHLAVWQAERECCVEFSRHRAVFWWIHH